MRFLKELGFGAVETPVGPETDMSRLREHIARCTDAGLKVSLHPYSEASIFNPLYFSPEADNPCRELHERFFAMAAEAARMQQFPTVVNVHGAAGGSDDAREHLLSQSIAFFTWAGQWCRDNAPQVGVTVELQISPDPGEPRQRIGDTYAELLNVAKESNVGVCWDFGHAYWNTRRFGWPIQPPKALLKRIVHVHCHDALNGGPSAARSRHGALAGVHPAPARPRLRRPGDSRSPPGLLPPRRRPPNPHRLRPRP